LPFSSCASRLAAAAAAAAAANIHIFISGAMILP
jgi:hypothetical protein